MAKHNVSQSVDTNRLVARSLGADGPRRGERAPLFAPRPPRNPQSVEAAVSAPRPLPQQASGWLRHAGLRLGRGRSSWQESSRLGSAPEFSRILPSRIARMRKRLGRSPSLTSGRSPQDGAAPSAGSPGRGERPSRAAARRPPRPALAHSRRGLG